MAHKPKIRVTSIDVFGKIVDLIFLNAIMTPKAQFEYCRPEDSLEDKLKIMQQYNFDCLPMLQGPILETGDFKEYVTQEKTEENITKGFRFCRDAATRIAEKDKLPELLPLRQFINCKPFQNIKFKVPIFLTNGKMQVTGLVTLADMDKVAARMYFFALFSELELSLLTLISDKYSSFREICRCKCCESKRDFRKRKQSMDELEGYYYLYIKEIFHIVLESPSVSKVHDEVKIFLNREGYSNMVDLRNNIMHPKPLVSQKFPIDKLSDIQNSITNLLLIFKTQS